jgi:hypothetical protein
LVQTMTQPLIVPEGKDGEGLLMKSMTIAW